MAATLVLNSPEARKEATRWITIAPDGSTVTFKRPGEGQKTNPQTNKFHVMCREVAEQVPEYYGIHMDEESWKDVFLDALFGGETRLVPKLNRMGMLPLSPHWKALTIKEAMDAITIVTAFGDMNKVVFKADGGLIIEGKVANGRQERLG